jgi:hypothetical protein
VFYLQFLDLNPPSPILLFQSKDELPELLNNVLVTSDATVSLRVEDPDHTVTVEVEAGLDLID